MNQSHVSQTPATREDLRPSTKDRSRSVRSIAEHLFLRETDSLYIFLILAGLTLIGFILRVLDINKSIAYDEAYTFIHFASRELKYIVGDYSAPNNHIFHTLLVGIAYRLFGGEAWVLRLPAFTAGTLMIPAMFIAARRFFSASQALAAAGIIAVLPVFINYSVNGRGYTLLILFALLLANFAGVLVHQQSRLALAAFGLTTVFGFYTIPIFLYPWAGVALWVAATYLFADEPWQARLRKLMTFLGMCALAGFCTFVLYSPVIFFGSGLSSLIRNEMVQPLDWQTFLANLDPRLIKAWNKWMIGISPQTENIFLGGFLISVLLYRRVSNQKLPMQVFLVLAVLILLLLQRVTPLPRIWLYLEAFYLMFAAAGLVWLGDMILRPVLGNRLVTRVLSFAVLLIFAGVFVSMMVERQTNPVLLDRDRLPEDYAAEYLATHLRPEDTLVATGPVDIQTAYYLSRHDIPFERFYRRDHPVDIQHALVLVRKNSRQKTPESVVEFFKLDQELDVNTAELVFEYANVQVFSIQAR